MNKKGLLKLCKRLQEEKEEHDDGNDHEENAMRADINEILEKLDDDEHDYLENKTSKSISQDIYDVLKIHFDDEEEIEKIYNKLNGYRYVENINELHVGKDIKTIRIQNPYDLSFNKLNSKLKYKGRVTNIVFEDNGVLVRSVLFTGKTIFQNYKYDNFLTFQKLTPDEIIIITLLENANDET